MKKSLRFLAVACAVFLIAACRVYTPIQQPVDVLFEGGTVGEALPGYEVYYHNSNTVYKLEDVRTSNDTIYGFAVKADTTKVAAKKNDMNIFSKTETVIADSTPVAIHRSEIANVEMMGRDGRASFLKSTAAIALLLVIIISAVLVAGLIGLSVLASNASSDGSNESSDQSSDSGTSNSDSGSGTSNSGCYIATMVYGSYDAPEVWVLRRFRDNVLQHSRSGRWFIGWYYSWSPRFVAKYSKYAFVHRAAKACLQPFIWLLK
jgi:hypothetical protein